MIIQKIDQLELILEWEPSVDPLKNLIAQLLKQDNCSETAPQQKTNNRRKSLRRSPQPRRESISDDEFSKEGLDNQIRKTWEGKSIKTVSWDRFYEGYYKSFKKHIQQLAKRV